MRGKTIHSPRAPSAISAKKYIRINQVREGSNWTRSSSIQELESRKFCYEDSSAVFL